VPSLRVEVEDALAISRAHPSVDDARVPVYDANTGAAVLELDIRTELPSRWRANGESRSGVRLVETVRFELPPAFPSRPPRVVLRTDFNRSLPHINPHDAGQPVPPCVYWGDLGELMHRSGFSAVITQVADWLEKAAFEKLINKQQGWEPIRRDSIEDKAFFERGKLEGLVERTEGRKFLRLSYFRISIPDVSEVKHRVVALIGDDSVSVNSKTINQQIRGEFIDEGFKRGPSIAILAWPGKDPSGRPVTCDQYLPETVSNYGDLVRRAEAYGCGAALRQAVKWLSRCVSDLKSDDTFPIVVVLCVRRPLPLIGIDSNLELIPYRIDVSAPEFLPQGDGTRVYSMAHYETVSRGLLQRMSDLNFQAESPVYTILGCGSLGSKIALHLARAGIGPSHLVDKKGMTPHNAARHALPPSASPALEIALPSKSRALAELVKNLGQESVGRDLDILEVGTQTAAFRELFSKKQLLIVNATASHAVREHLASLQGLNSRVVDGAILRAGGAGILTVEGPDRNPNCLDLMAEVYESMRQDDALRVLLAAEDPDSVEIVGQGCGSPTLRMSDAKVSMYAAAISERIRQLLAKEMPQAGEILIGQLGGDGISLTWNRIAVPPVEVVSAENDRTWTIRIADRAHRKILAEVAAYPRVETGGIVVGRVSPTRRVMFVTDVLPAPKDSRRSASMFVLGTDGVDVVRVGYEQRSAGALWFLGTWHSHLADQGGSPRDYATARQIASSGHSPVLLLIRRPNGYSAIVATANV